MESRVEKFDCTEEGLIMHKIAMYTTSKLYGNRTTGGVKRFFELYKGLINSGADVDLFCSDSNEELSEKSITAYTLKNKQVGKSMFIPTELIYLFSNIGMIKKMKQTNYDSIIVFDVPQATSLCLMGLRHIQLFIRQDLIGYKKVILAGRTNSRMKKAIYIWIMKICETICLLKAEKILIQCKYDYNELIKRHKLIKKIIKRKSVIQINNVNPSWIVEKSVEKNVEEIKLEWKPKKSKFVIGFVGDFNDDRKGQEILIDAVINLLDKGFVLEVILVGDGKQLEFYKEKCQDYSTIMFTGRLNNPIGIIKMCDLLVVPSLADSCPNTVMEALYNEIPVIGARSGGIPEILESEESLFEPNALSLQSKIEFFLNNENLLQLKEKQKIRKTELEFDWSSVMIKHLEC